MTSKSKIEWTEATWNPITGCTIASPGCTNCYAMKEAYRFGFNPKTPQYHGLTKKVNGNAVWTGKMNLSESALLKPLKRKKPTMYFVNSMGDLFHEDVPDEWIDLVFQVMSLCPEHTFQVLTKRHERMREYLSRSSGNGKTDIRNTIAWAGTTLTLKAVAPNWTSEGIDGKWRSRAIQACTIWPLPNVWLGVSVEDQTRADERIPALMDTPAAVRFVSAEPLLGPVDLTTINPASLGPSLNALTGDLIWTAGLAAKSHRRLDWVIAGGESGPKARPMHPDWARSLRDQCEAAGVPFFFKQWGEWAPREKCLPILDGDVDAWPDGTIGKGDANSNGGFGWPLLRVGKKTAGRLLDGCEWNGMPEVT